MKTRKEIKYIINSDTQIKLVTALNQIAVYDQHIQQNNNNMLKYYKVTSIYFDDDYLSLYREKINGEYSKEKYRIRLYNNDLNTVFVEYKRSEGIVKYKHTEQISSQIIDDILTDKINIQDIVNLGKRKLMLKPVIKIEYIRIPFIISNSNTRVTIDIGIKTIGLSGENNISDIMIKDTISINQAKRNILEIKYDNSIPDILSDIITRVPRQITGYSKYAIAMSCIN